MDLTAEIEELNEQIKTLFPGYQFDLGELLGLLIQGKITDVMKMLFQNMAQILQGELKSAAGIFVTLLCIGLIAALLMNLTDLFENKQIADIGFYFVYLFLILILLRVFGTVSDTAAGMLSDMLLFMKLFMPVYFMAIGAASGVTTALLYYQFILLLIYGVEAVLASFLMPVIEVYIFLSFMNGLWSDEKLHMLLDLIHRIIGYLLKLSFAVITGIGLLQTMITPVIDSVKLSAVRRGIALIPGVGNISDSVAEMVIGSAVLIKNSVGALAVLLLLLLCVIPAAKIWGLAMLLKAAAAITGIVSDHRLTGCMDRVGEGSLLVLRTLLTAMGLFLIMIAIAAMTMGRAF